jgi:hypothetical protein
MRPGLVVTLLCCAGAAAGAASMAVYRGVPGDFARYHRAGRLVATGNADLLYDAEHLAARRVYAEERASESPEVRPGKEAFPEEEFKYLPATAVLMAPLGSMRLYPAKVVWGAWNGFLIGLLFATCWRACAGGRSGWLLLVPVGLLFATLGMVFLAWRKDAAAGAFVGFGAVVKFMPVFLAVWFAWKRRWKALRALALAVVVLGWLLPAAARGPERAPCLTKQYLPRTSPRTRSRRSPTACWATPCPGRRPPSARSASTSSRSRRRSCGGS